MYLCNMRDTVEHADDVRWSTDFGTRGIPILFHDRQIAAGFWREWCLRQGHLYRPKVTLPAGPGFKRPKHGLMVNTENPPPRVLLAVVSLATVGGEEYAL